MFPPLAVSSVMTTGVAVGGCGGVAVGGGGGVAGGGGAGVTVGGIVCVGSGVGVGWTGVDVGGMGVNVGVGGGEFCKNPAEGKEKALPSNKVRNTVTTPTQKSRRRIRL